MIEVKIGVLLIIVWFYKVNSFSKISYGKKESALNDADFLARFASGVSPIFMSISVG